MASLMHLCSDAIPNRGIVCDVVYAFIKKHVLNCFLSKKFPFKVLRIKQHLELLKYSIAGIEKRVQSRFYVFNIPLALKKRFPECHDRNYQWIIFVHLHFAALNRSMVSCLQPWSAFSKYIYQTRRNWLLCGSKSFCFILFGEYGAHWLLWYLTISLHVFVRPIRNIAAFIKFWWF